MINPEVIGFIGAIVLVYSLFKTDMVKLRKWGIVSNICYIIYALMFSPVLYSILAINVMIVLIHIHKLREYYANT